MVRGKLLSELLVLCTLWFYYLIRSTYQNACMHRHMQSASGWTSRLRTSDILNKERNPFLCRVECLNPPNPLPHTPQRFALLPSTFMNSRDRINLTGCRKSPRKRRVGAESNGSPAPSQGAGCTPAKNDRLLIYIYLHCWHP